MRKAFLNAICAGAVAMTVASSQAAVVNVTELLGLGNDYPANEIADLTGQPGLGDQNTLDWIEALADLADLPAPTTEQTDYTGGQIRAGDYLVLHYGVGPNGNTGTGGGLVGLYFDTDMASFDVPASGAGPNGDGGLSFARLYDHGGDEVPDSGTTLALLGAGLTGLGAMSRRFRK